MASNTQSHDYEKVDFNENPFKPWAVNDSGELADPIRIRYFFRSDEIKGQLLWKDLIVDS
ncbi:hypothetical protein BELL_0244g00160 [Botrytis elliptica]|uniref:Uncharacterized protein n=1 Tax=Botrytis elliptica TaxID=278938 RepID=A0A4Z1JMJ6_9HELO|nr:hypothetical protein BELL_0244g00160 [Botrytis elliptica]